MSYQKAMEAAGAKIIAFEQFGSYQGDWWAKVEYENQIGWVHGSYGSCSGRDAFESEFGWDEEHCEDHKYNDTPTDCKKCIEIKKNYEDRLIAFGECYLDLISYEEAVSKASENLDWDGDAQEMVDWIKAQA